MTRIMGNISNKDCTQGGRFFFVFVIYFDKEDFAIFVQMNCIYKELY